MEAYGDKEQETGEGIPYCKTPKRSGQTDEHQEKEECLVPKGLERKEYNSLHRAQKSKYPFTIGFKLPSVPNKTHQGPKKDHPHIKGIHIGVYHG